MKTFKEITKKLPSFCEKLPLEHQKALWDVLDSAYFMGARDAAEEITEHLNGKRHHFQSFLDS